MTSRNDAVREVTAAFAIESHRPPFKLRDFVRAFGGGEIAASLSGVHAWPDVPPEAFNCIMGGSIGAYLGFMESEMFRAFVPAWMVQVLRHGDADQDAIAALVVSLDPDMSRRMWKEDRFATRKAAMTLVERRAVATFGKAVAGDTALTMSWGHDPGPAIAAAWSG